MKSVKSTMKHNIWYFAYGSNIKESQLKERGINPRNYKAGYINNFYLRFNKKSTDGSGKANIERKEGEKVWGVFYRISEAEYLNLHENFEKGYNQIELSGTVQDEHCLAKTFIASSQRIDDSLMPTQKYKKIIIEGAEEKRLPKEYISFLKRTETSWA